LFTFKQRFDVPNKSSSVVRTRHRRLAFIIVVIIVIIIVIIAIMPSSFEPSRAWNLQETVFVLFSSTEVHLTFHTLGGGNHRDFEEAWIPYSTVIQLSAFYANVAP
jgi:hypothetical protein